MKAILQEKRGKAFSTMQVAEIEAQTPNTNEVKIRVKSSRINPVDMDLLKGFPSLNYKKPQIGGVDGAGEIIELGSSVSQFNVGDQVYFYCMFSDFGTWAEEITIDASYLAKIPSNVETEQAGAIALPILTALESLWSLDPKAGEVILIHGAGGGVGFQAVQLAKTIGLEVIANASERDREKLTNTGVSRFIDYQKEDFSKSLGADKPDYILDVVGKDTLTKSIKLKPKKVVSTAFPEVNKIHKTGVALPGMLKFLMRMMGRKFEKLAKKMDVELIGQVTGANGQNLAKASHIAEQSNFIVSPYRTKTLDEISKSGLTAKDVGTIIVF